MNFEKPVLFSASLGIGLVDRINQAEEGSDEKLAALRVYRMLQDKSNRRKQIVTGWMASEWHKHFEGQGETQRQLLSHLDYAMDFVEANLPQFDGLVQHPVQGKEDRDLNDHG